MTAQNWPACLAFTLAEEGGYTDDAGDPGGPTNFGITLATLTSWRGVACSAEDVHELTQVEVVALYRERYWDVVRGDDLPAGLDLMVWDEGVNAGPATAARFLQRAVNTTPDGEIGPLTLAACAAVDPVATINAMSAMMDAYYRSRPGFAEFGNDWTGRLQRRTALALQMATTPTGAQT